jgi:glyoxylase-like metal-dependent hydrolase (beta-lactamase superfamily II)
MKSKTLKTIVLIFSLTLIVSSIGCAGQQNRFSPLTDASIKGDINIARYDDVTIHSYTAPAQAARVTTQIIETPSVLVVIDTQFVRPMAKEVAAYIKTLGKPVDRVIVSHDHPDHWFGLEYFSEYPVYALAETIEGIKKTGDFFIQMRNKQDPDNIFPDEKTIPPNVLKTGEETIGGVRFVFEKIVEPGEASSQLIIKLPELSTIIVQDFVFNKAHVYLGQNAFDGWINTLKKLDGNKAYKSVLVGHGTPANASSAYKEMIAYLEDVKTIRQASKNPEEMIESLVKAYPDYELQALLHMSVPMLYSEGH